jgi:O-acetyl-ADP-ribose deacetylase (regulator of RNase III)
MITYVSASLFQSPAKVLVNTVNTVGVMGKGIALDFKRIYPEMFQQYQALCEAKKFDIGQLWLYKTPHKWILNFPTKRHWRDKSRPEYIEAGLQKFVDTYDQRGISSISFPQLGCGNGELDWELQVQPLMERYLQALPIDVFIHVYQQPLPFTPEHRSIEEVKAWLRGQPETLGFTEVWHDLRDVFKARSCFKTLDTQQEFSAEIVIYEGIEGLMLTADNNSLFIERERLLDLWQHIRNAGYCRGIAFPSGLDKVASYLVTVLDELDYIEAIGLSVVRAGAPMLGVQFIPPLLMNPVQRQSLQLLASS